MAIITANGGNQVTLEDAVKYLLTLIKISVQRGKVFAGSDPVDQLTMTWAVDGQDDAARILTFASLKLGKNKQTGKPAALRQVLNALAGRPEDTDILSFDDETFEWKYPDGSYSLSPIDSEGVERELPDGSIIIEWPATPGMRVAVVGEMKTSKTGGSYYRPTMWRPEAPGKKAIKRSVTEFAPAQVEPFSIDPDEIPF
jgi:hypothetical protein